MAITENGNKKWLRLMSMFGLVLVLTSLHTAGVNADDDDEDEDDTEMSLRDIDSSTTRRKTRIIGGRGSRSTRSRRSSTYRYESGRTTAQIKADFQQEMEDRKRENESLKRMRKLAARAIESLKAEQESLENDLNRLQAEHEVFDGAVHEDEREWENESFWHKVPIIKSIVRPGALDNDLDDLSTMRDNLDKYEDEAKKKKAAIEARIKIQMAQIRKSQRLMEKNNSMIASLEAKIKTARDETQSGLDADILAILDEYDTEGSDSDGDPDQETSGTSSSKMAALIKFILQQVGIDMDSLSGDQKKGIAKAILQILKNGSKSKKSGCYDRPTAPIIEGCFPGLQNEALIAQLKEFLGPDAGGVDANALQNAIRIALLQLGVPGGSRTIATSNPADLQRRIDELRAQQQAQLAPFDQMIAQLEAQKLFNADNINTLGMMMLKLDVLKAQLGGDEAKLLARKLEIEAIIKDTVLGDYIKNQIMKIMNNFCALVQMCGQNVKAEKFDDVLKTLLESPTGTSLKLEKSENSIKKVIIDPPGNKGSKIIDDMDDASGTKIGEKWNSNNREPQSQKKREPGIF